MTTGAQAASRSDAAGGACRRRLGMSDTHATPGAETTFVQPSGGGRSIAAVVCVVLAALLTTPAALAYWGHRTLTDTQRYVDTVGPLVNAPQVQDAIATTVTDAIKSRVDVEAILEGCVRRCHHRRAAVGAVGGADRRCDRWFDRTRGPRVRCLRHLRRSVGGGEHAGAAGIGAGAGGGQQRRDSGGGRQDRPGSFRRHRAGPGTDWSPAG